MRADSVLRLDIAQHPASPVEVYRHGPALLGPLALGSEYSDLDIWTLGLAPADGDVLDVAHGKRGPAAQYQRARSPGGCHGLELDLWQVDEVLVVEIGVVRVQSVLDGCVEGIWGLRDSRGCRGSHEGLWIAGWRGR